MTGLDVGQSIYYECVTGYSTGDLNYITCGQNGTWSEHPRCEGDSIHVLFIHQISQVDINLLLFQTSLVRFVCEKAKHYFC